MGRQPNCRLTVRRLFLSLVEKRDYVVGFSASPNLGSLSLLTRSLETVSLVKRPGLERVGV
jgi:hypothetical protein